jgi:hypothetical protein
VALATVSAVAVLAVGVLLLLPRDRPTTADGFS